jgi:hypothetical protein
MQIFSQIHSPIRFLPAIGVMAGAHYRTLLMFFMFQNTINSNRRQISSFFFTFIDLGRYISTSRSIPLQNVVILHSLSEKSVNACVQFSGDRTQKEFLKSLFNY